MKQQFALETRASVDGAEALQTVSADFITGLKREFAAKIRHREFDISVSFVIDGAIIISG